MKPIPNVLSQPLIHLENVLVPLSPLLKSYSATAVQRLSPFSRATCSKYHKLAIFGNIFNCHNWEVLLASRGQKSEMLLNTLQCTGQLRLPPPPPRPLSCSKCQAAETENSCNFLSMTHKLLKRKNVTLYTSTVDLLD